MDVSILIATIRLEGVEELLQSLSCQSHPATEIILVDGFYESRKDSLRRLAYQLGVDLIHLPEPPLSYNTHPNGCSNINLAIAHARYELCIFLGDFHIISRDFILAHTQLYRLGYGGIMRWLLARDVGFLPHDEFLSKLAEAPGLTMQEAEERFNRKYGWNREFREEWGQSWIDKHYEDERVAILRKTLNQPLKDEVVVNISPEWWWPNTSSAPLRYLLAVNGFDERFHGGGGCEDVDIASRMSRLGLKYAMDIGVTGYHVDVTLSTTRRHKYPLCTLHDKKPFTNNAYYQSPTPDLLENDQLLTWVDGGVRYCRCKECGWHGVIDSGELLRVNNEAGLIQAPTHSLGIARTNIPEIRRKMGLPPLDHI